MPVDESRSVEDTPMSQRLTNEDFRKLLMTPRSTPSGGTHAPGSVREAMANAGSMPPPTENKGELRRKKKSFYAALKKKEDDKLAELADKYRDRAKERREGTNEDGTSADPTSNTSSAYRAVAPDVKSGIDAKERRRQLIQESKYLGGDMEHTHLVKGLDYALLQKVRSEITTREQEQEAEMERLASAPAPAPGGGEGEGAGRTEAGRPSEVIEEELNFATPMGKEIYSLVMDHKKKVSRSEMFLPGRMAYVVELDDDNTVDTDIPTTLTRSKEDVPTLEEGNAGSNANDMLIDKLTQIFSYLRHGARHKKSKKTKEKPTEKSNQDESIYGDIGEYKVDARRTRHVSGTDTHRPRDGYFGEPPDQGASVGGGVGGGVGVGVGGGVGVGVGAALGRSALLSRLTAEPAGYEECYPGLREMDDAIDDSDDEADYTKMDRNKKAAIGRWDFDTTEEYSTYMSNKEAMPKAAFQYGVKTQDGRKTRKTRDKNDKHELDREWQQIQNIISKRKAPANSGDIPNVKVGRY